jgi:NAD(P)-dependent dehydrogenase (short-subunit alcohol dehydrogenase family)
MTPATTPVILITGASSGIGFALARAFAADGAHLVLNARDEAKLIRAAETLAGGGGRALVPGDIGAADTARRMLDVAVQRFGRADVLVNNAGVFTAKPIQDYTRAEIDSFLGVNLRGTILMTQAMVARLRAQKSGGAIVNVTSSISMAPLGTVPASAPNASKGGINAFTRSVALEVARDGIRVNAVAPGLIKTPLHGRTDAQFGEIAHLQPVGHVGEVDDVVAAVRYLAAAPFVTGVVLPVDGGASLGHW